MNGSAFGTLRQWHVAILAGFSGVLFILLLGVNFRTMTDLSQAVFHMDADLAREERLRQVAEGTLELQAARRGYVLTGEDRFVQSFELTATAVAQAMAALRAHPDSEGALAGTQQQIAAYVQALRNSVALRRRDPSAVGEQQRITLLGEASSRAIHQQLDALRVGVAKQRDQDSRLVLLSTQRVQVGQAVLSAIGLLLLMLAAFAVRAQFRRRQAAQRALERANEELESRVAERTAAHEAAAARSRRVVDLSADAILLCGADATILYANPAALALTESGHAGGLLGRSVHSLVAPAVLESIGALLEPLWRAPGQLAFTDCTIISARGKAVAVRLSAVSYFEDEALRVQLVVHDVTQLRLEEAARLEQLYFIDQLFEAIPTPLSVRDERGDFLRVNRAYEAVYGRSRDTLLRRAVFDVFDYDVACEIAGHDHAAMRTAEPLTYQSRLRQLDMSEKELLVGVRALRRPDGSVVGVIAVETDVTEIRRQRDELQKISAEREQLSKRLIRSQEEERRRIGRDLHDQVGQILTALKMSLDVAAVTAGTSSQLLVRPAELTDEALRAVRSLTSSLHPHLLEDLGLEAAVRWLAERYVHPAVKSLAVEIRLSPTRSHAAGELVAYRVVQEALTNVLRHARAQAVAVRLDAEEGRLRVQVQDDGRGFDTAGADSRSLGLSSMRERLSEIGGRLDIASVAGQGTRVLAELPW